jgi:hypothetical protein
MSYSFPLQLSEFWDKLEISEMTALDLYQRQKHSEDQAGNAYRATFGVQQWRSKCTLNKLEHDDAKRQEALFKMIQARQGTFFAYDKRLPYPAFDPEGAMMEVGSNVDLNEEASFGDAANGVYRYEGGSVTRGQAASIVNDAGAYFDADGFLQTQSANSHRVDYGPFANLLDLRYVNDFNNAFWAKANTSTTANAATAPDGTVTADKVAENSSNAAHYIERQTIRAKTNADICWSVFVKAAGRTRVGLNVFDSVTANNLAVNINLATGSIESSGAAGTASNLTASITAVGDGWYRLKLSGKAASADSASLYSVRLYLRDNSGSASYAGDGSSGVYVWGGITNYGTVAPTYPRLPLGLLAEASFTQRLTRSREFDNAAWTKLRSTAFQSPAVLDPWNTGTCEKIVEDTSAGTHVVYQNYTTSNFVNHVAYVIAKAGERTKIVFGLSNFTTTSCFATFDLLAGTVSGVTSGSGDMTGATAAIYDLGNGWYWCEIEALKVTGDSDCIPEISLVNAAGATSYTGDGTSGVYLAHAQLEEGTVGHLPVISTSAAVLRAGDQFTFRARGTNDFVLTFDNDTTQSGPGAVGNWSPLSAGFLRPHIKGWTAARKVQPGATSVLVKTKGSNNRSLSLKGLQPFFQLSIGDKIGIGDGTGKRALLELMEDVTADYLGDTAEFEVQPFLATWIGVDQSVELAKPRGKFKIVPNSFKPATIVREASSGASFEIMSVAA